MSAPNGNRSDYRERVRLARERVQAAQKGEESRQHGSQEDTRDLHVSHDAVSAEPPQMKQGNPQSPQRGQRDVPPPSSIPAMSQDHASTSRPPPRPYRADNNSWFATGPGPDPRQISQSGQPRYQVSSHAHTDSTHSFGDSVDNSTTAGPSRSSYVTASHPASHHSSVSSIGEIPDFPIAQHEDSYGPLPIHPPQFHMPAPAHARRVANLGPPPAAAGRRGASSLYSRHQSYVSPIPEESPGSSPRMDRFSTIAASESSLGRVDERLENTFLDDPSDESNHNTFDPDSDIALISPGLVRQVSLGRKGKPSQVLVRSSHGSAAKSISPESSSEAITPTMRESAAAPSSHVGYEPRTSAFAFPLNTAVSSEHGAPNSNLSSARSVSPLTPVVEKILGGLEKGGALPRGVSAPPVQDAPSATPRSGATTAQNREDRVSTTSLVDLIRRAGKVRTNLDRGKTASRLNMLDMFGSKENLKRFEKGDRGSMSDSVNSGMIGWLPQAYGGAGHPAYTEKALEEGHPSRRAIKEKVRRDRRKRCCGMPQWLFALLVVLIVICLAAAIIVPVELLVVPHQGDGTGATLANCPATNGCLNDGVSVVFNGTCSCACAHGFTGKTCQQQPDSACGSTTVPDILGNVTMGSNVTNLIGRASKFNIPLNATALVAAFSHAGLSCSDENALVQLSGPSNQKRSLEKASNVHEDAAPTPTPQASLAVHRDLELKRNVVTSASLDFAGTASPTAHANATGTASAANASSTSVGNPSVGYYDFARIATLYILQQTADIQIAEQAHSDLQQVFSAKIFALQDVQITNAVSVDMNTGFVTINGITVGTGNGVPT